MEIEQAVKILEEHLRTGKELGEDLPPVSDYDHFVHDKYIAVKTLLEHVKGEG